MTEIGAPPLWLQLQLTARVVYQVGQGRSGTAALDDVPGDLRPGIQSLSFSVLRSLGLAISLRKLLARREPSAQASALLQTALVLLCRDEGASYDTFTLVNQAVEAAKRTLNIKPQAAFINACLRRFLRERVFLMAQARTDIVARLNHPTWWIDQLQKDWPDQWEDILAANNCHAPLTLRVNSRRTSPQAYLTLLASAGLMAREVGRSGVQLSAAVGVHQLPGFADGLVSVQDSAAQLAAHLLLEGMPRERPLRILDACAAPGGKTAHLLEVADCSVTALDVDASRCERVHQNLHRLGLAAKVVVADARDVRTWWDGVPFDAILLDAPCSASGIVRRHPDIRWLRRPADIAQLAAIQANLLNCLWPLLGSSGRLLFSTCSVFKSEGELQVKAFLARNKMARLLASPGHLLPGDRTMDMATIGDQPDDHDGFYYALLEKTLG